jgi:triacylglycerol lipase
MVREDIRDMSKFSTMSSFALMFFLFAIIFIGCDDNKSDKRFPILGSAAEDTTDTDTDGNDDTVEGNNYPIVLLHGFIGWGRDELAGAYGHFYWGGYHDLQEILKKAGHDTYTAVVGPFSSNWDRTCELYAQLKGVRVDYGLAHSIKHRHSRFGRDFTGKALLADWGRPGKNRKIHIITHSQGGMNSRMFAQLLEHGHPDEKQADYSEQEPISPLFTGSAETKNLISSISTMAGVHNGTTLDNGMIKLVPLIQEILITLLEAVGIDSSNSFAKIYDFKLDQFGVVPRQKGESLQDYFTRVNEAAETYFNGDQKDICLWDLSPEGCKEQNAWVHAQNGIYYFSYAGVASHPSDSSMMRDNGEYYHIADADSFMMWIVTTPMMGAYTCNDDRYHGYWRAKDGEFFNMAVKDRVPIDSSWWPNDGVVNTKSMNGPWLYPDGYTGVRDSIVDWDGTSIPDRGVWNYFGVLKGFDHFDIIGGEIFYWDKGDHPKDAIESPEDWYVTRAEYLQSLPRK